jgi:sugar lactone lactonase YvrE
MVTAGDWGGFAVGGSRFSLVVVLVVSAIVPSAVAASPGVPIIRTIAHATGYANAFVPYLAADAKGDVWFVAGGLGGAHEYVVYKRTPDGRIAPFAGGCGTHCPSGGRLVDGAPATSTPISGPATNLAVDAKGNVYLGDVLRAQIWEVRLDGKIKRIAGCLTACPLGDGGPATQARVQPGGLAVDGQGNIYLADGADGPRVRKISPNGIISTFAGNGAFGDSGDGGPAVNAQLRPVVGGLAVDAKGNLYIGEAGRVRKVSPGGIITTVAGTGTTGAYSGNGGPARKAQLYYVMAIAIDAAGNVYLADQRSTVRKIDRAGTITLFAGSGGAAAAGFRGDGGPATKALLAGPTSLAVDAKRNVYIADSQNARVREVSYGTKPRATRALTAFASQLELDLSQLATARKTLKNALARVAACTISPTAGATQVAAVAASREHVLARLAALAAPTAQAVRIKSLLKAALAYSISADLHYRDWLASQGARCPTSSTADLRAARRLDLQASAAKQAFVAAFNPLARLLHFRVWSAQAI